MSSMIVCCGSVLLVFALMYLLRLLVQAGCSLLTGCIANGFVFLLAASLLGIYLKIMDAKVCDSWLMRDFVCIQ